MRKSKSIAVVGGTGFLGSRICREASLRGLTVVSLSRSPPLPSLLSHSWAQRVDWRAADVLGSSAGSEGKAEWKALFEGRDAVVHCVGQLLADGTYKDALKNRDPLKLVGIAANGAKEVVGGLAGAAYNVAQSVSSGRASSTPSFAGGGSSSSFGAPSWTSSSSSSSSFGSASNTQMLYAVNRDSALVTANAAADAKVGQFVFVSAAELFPFQTDYVKSKRQAERMIMDPSTYNFTSVIFRPGGVFETAWAFIVAQFVS